ncbi:MAG: peptidylprolyl isomerase [Thermoanaerobaculales bacterium]
MNTFTRCILTICIVSLAASSAAQEAVPPAANLNPAVLRVNDDTVYAAEISLVMQNIAGQIGDREKAPDNQELVQLATQRVVEQKLLAQEARRFGLKPDELRVAQMVQAAEQQSGGREALATNLEGVGSSYEDLIAMVREMILVRTFIAKQISPTIQVSDEEIATFYAEHPDLFQTGEQVHARHILFAAAEGADAATVATAQAKAEQARKRALAGEDFATLAGQLSEGPSAPKGGDLGFFERDKMLKPISDAAFALKPGEVSEVVRTSFGFHVIKVEELRPAATQSLEEAEPRVRKMLVQQKTGQTIADLLKTLTEAATIEPLINQPSTAGAAPGRATVLE